MRSSDETKTDDVIRPVWASGNSGSGTPAQPKPVAAAPAPSSTPAPAPTQPAPQAMAPATPVQQPAAPQTPKPPAQSNWSAEKPAKSSKKWLLAIPVVLVLVVAAAASTFFYMQYKESQDKLKNPDKVAQEQTLALVEAVGKHVDLPTGEKPTVATVSDVSKLSSQTFFAAAKNGDKVLIYTKAKKAVLYRPLEDKVINVAPLNLSNQQNSQTQSQPQPTKP